MNYRVKTIKTESGLEYGAILNEEQMKISLLGSIFTKTKKEVLDIFALLPCKKLEIIYEEETRIIEPADEKDRAEAIGEYSFDVRPTQEFFDKVELDDLFDEPTKRMKWDYLEKSNKTVREIDFSDDE